DSPYPHIVLCCEKASYHEHLRSLAQHLRITYVSLAGEGSYEVFEDWVNRLKAAGVDLDQPFHLFTATDFDPHGYYIEDAAKDHLQRAGIPHVSIHRVYLMASQITAGMRDRYAVPYTANDLGARTHYNTFGQLTGGLYKSRGEWVSFPRRDDGTYDVPDLTEG